MSIKRPDPTELAADLQPVPGSSQVQTSIDSENNSLSRSWGEGGQRPGEGAVEWYQHTTQPVATNHFIRSGALAGVAGFMQEGMHGLLQNVWLDRFNEV